MSNPYSSPTSKEDTRHSNAAASHSTLPAPVAVGGMSVLGVVAMMAQWLKEGWLWRWLVPHDPILTLFLCGSIAALVGLASIPFVTSCLAGKNWYKRATWVYGTNAVLVIAYVLLKPTGLTGPLSAAVVAYIGVVVMAQMLRET